MAEHLPRTEMDDIERESTRQKRVDELRDEPDYQPTDWKKVVKSWKFLAFCLVVIAVIVLVVLISVDKNKIVSKLTPIAERIRAIPAGWLIPIVILIALSFPPLFGHEIIALLCGVVYGLWVGFGIVAAGTIFGEIATWFAFKYALRRKAQELERTNLNYGALARLIREGGFWMVVAVRLSVVPSHMSTAVLSTCDVDFWHYLIAAFISLPKQLIVVYIGTLLAGGQSETLVKALVFVVGFGFTIGVSVYMWKKLNKHKKALLREQSERKALRERRQQEAQNFLPKVTTDSTELGIESVEPSRETQVASTGPPQSTSM